MTMTYDKEQVLGSFVERFWASDEGKALREKMKYDIENYWQYGISPEVAHLYTTPKQSRERRKAVGWPIYKLEGELTDDT